MTEEKFKKGIELQECIKIIDKYISKFNPNQNIVWLQTQDYFGNKHQMLDLYAHDEAIKGATKSISYKYDNFTSYYEEFLKKCVNDLQLRKAELEQEFNNL